MAIDRTTRGELGEDPTPRQWTVEYWTTVAVRTAGPGEDVPEIIGKGEE